jgi:hypothetical protein
MQMAMYKYLYIFEKTGYYMVHDLSLSNVFLTNDVVSFSHNIFSKNDTLSKPNLSKIINYFHIMAPVIPAIRTAIAGFNKVFEINDNISENEQRIYILMKENKQILENYTTWKITNEYNVN